jgi:hypothetical protein
MCPLQVVYGSAFNGVALEKQQQLGSYSYVMQLAAEHDVYRLIGVWLFCSSQLAACV